MFVVTNNLRQALTLSDGTILSAGQTRNLAQVNSSERGYAMRGWVTIREVEAAKTEPKKARTRAEGESASTTPT